MQDPLTSSFRWGETFDTAPYKGLLVSLYYNRCTPINPILSDLL